MAAVGGAVAAGEPGLPLEGDGVDGQRHAVSAVPLHFDGPAGTLLPVHGSAALQERPQVGGSNPHPTPPTPSYTDSTRHVCD